MNSIADTNYYKKCALMSFTELREYILKRLSVLALPIPTDYVGPRSKNDYMTLLKLLKSKIHENTFSNCNCTLLDIPFEHLEELERQLKEKQSDSSSTKRSINKLKNKIDFIRKTVTKLQDQRKREEERIKREKVMSHPINRKKHLDDIWRKIESTFAIEFAAPVNVTSNFLPGRCRLCGRPAMHAADVCYTCNTK